MATGELVETVLPVERLLAGGNPYSIRLGLMGGPTPRPPKDSRSTWQRVPSGTIALPAPRPVLTPRAGCPHDEGVPVTTRLGMFVRSKSGAGDASGQAQALK